MTVKEFYEKNKNNEQLKEKFKSSKSVEDMYELAKANGLTDSFETFKSDSEKIVIGSGDLTEEEIASISAGGCDASTYTITTMMTTTATLAFY